MTSRELKLSVQNHDRDRAGLTYVYPVLSRRAGGVSIGINLNPNNACNWHCAYCQVPDLVRGRAPAIDLVQLERELGGFLEDMESGDYLPGEALSGLSALRDIAFSGNGEPTSADEFPDAVALVERLRAKFGLEREVPIRVITNGSLMGQGRVQEGIRRLAAAGGEVWFKVDAGTKEAIERINGVSLDPRAIARNLSVSCELCTTWVQTCMFRWDGALPTDDDLEAYLDVVATAGPRRPAGILLYGIARPSMQREREHLAPLSQSELEAIAAKIEKRGLAVRVSP